MTEQKRAAITAKLESLKSSITGYGYEDADTQRWINHYEVMLNGESCGITDEGCEMCSG